MNIAIVTTTINVPEFLDAYAKDMREHGHDSACFIVIGDRKTPKSVPDFCRALQERYKYAVEYYGVPEQEAYLKAYPELAAYLPWNSVDRRNIGMVRAYELGAERILTVDDDNYLLEPDLLSQHLRVGETVTVPSYGSDSGWFDPCRFLVEKRGIPFHHRGFPMEQRWKESAITEGKRSGRIIVNVGLWHGDPDVDAWTRMTFPLETNQWTLAENITTASGTWSPFNSQQTTLLRETLPAYFLNPNAGRYDDIWASYIIHRVAQHLGDIVTYGHPIVNHLQKRSLASLWEDLDGERMGIQLTGKFTDALRKVTLTGSTYADCADEVVQGLRSHGHDASLTPEMQTFIAEYARGMEMWKLTLHKAHERAREGR